MNENYNTDIRKTKQEAIVAAQAKDNSILKGSITGLG